MPHEPLASQGCERPLGRHHRDDRRGPHALLAVERDQGGAVPMGNSDMLASMVYIIALGMAADSSVTLAPIRRQSTGNVGVRVALADIIAQSCPARPRIGWRWRWVTGSTAKSRTTSATRRARD